MLEVQVIADANDILTVAFFYEGNLFEVIAGNADEMFDLLEHVFEE